MKTDFKLFFSGKFDFLNFIKLGAMFVVSPELVSATASLQIVPGVTLDFFFEFSPRSPLDGLSFYVAFNDPDCRLIAGIIEAVNALFTTGINFSYNYLTNVTVNHSHQWCANGTRGYGICRF